MNEPRAIPADGAIHEPRNLVPDQIAEHFRPVDPEFARHVADAQVFDFGSFEDSTRLSYIVELFACGFIDTPYQTVLYRFGPPQQRMVLVIDRIPAIDAARGYRLEMYGQMRDRFELVNGGRFYFDQPDNPRIRTYITSAPRTLRADKKMQAEGRLGWKKKMEDWLIAFFLHCSLVLATEGVPRRVEEAPVRLNAKRARTGKPRIPTVTHIDFQMYAEAAAVEPGHHAPPVPHRRRGHIRRLEDGRKVWIRDCIVNASDDVKVARRDAYHVQQK